MRLATLKGKQRDLFIEIPGEEDGINIVYLPGEVTGDLLAAMRGAMNAGVEERVLPIFLAKVLVEWDLEDDVLTEDGEPTGETVALPCTEEGIQKVPISILGVMLQAIQEDARPTPTNTRSSSVSLRPEDSLDQSPNGTTSFGYPSTSE